MSVLRSLRELVLGETWSIPIGVGLTVGAGALLAELDAGFWDRFGAICLLAGVLLTLGVATRGGRSG